MLVAVLLEGEGNRVLRTRDGAEVLALLRGERADLVLADGRTPGPRSAEVVVRLRDEPDAAPATRVSGDAPGPLPPGATFPPKPFHIGQVQTTVASLLRCGQPRARRPCLPRAEDGRPRGASRADPRPRASAASP
jgi:CheY-like chemotaxis protein